MEALEIPHLPIRTPPRSARSTRTRRLDFLTARRKNRFNHRDKQFDEKELILESVQEVLNDIERIKSDNEVLSTRMNLLASKYESECNVELEYLEKFSSDRSLIESSKSRYLLTKEFEDMQSQLTYYTLKWESLKESFSPEALRKIKANIVEQNQLIALEKGDLHSIKEERTDIQQQMNDEGFLNSIKSYKQNRLQITQLRKELKKLSKTNRRMKSELQKSMLVDDEISDLENQRLELANRLKTLQYQRATREKEAVMFKEIIGKKKAILEEQKKMQEENTKRAPRRYRRTLQNRTENQDKHVDPVLVTETLQSKDAGENDTQAVQHPYANLNLSVLVHPAEGSKDTDTHTRGTEDILIEQASDDLSTDNVSQKEQNTAEKQQNAVIKDDNAAIKEENTAEKEDNTVIKEDNTAEKEQNALEDEKNVEEEQSFMEQQGEEKTKEVTIPLVQNEEDRISLVQDLEKENLVEEVDNYRNQESSNEPATHVNEAAQQQPTVDTTMSDNHEQPGSYEVNSQHPESKSEYQEQIEENVESLTARQSYTDNLNNPVEDNNQNPQIEHISTEADPSDELQSAHILSEIHTTEEPIAPSSQYINTVTTNTKDSASLDHSNNQETDAQQPLPELLQNITQQLSEHPKDSEQQSTQPSDVEQSSLSLKEIPLSPTDTQTPHPNNTKLTGIENDPPHNSEPQSQNTPTNPTSELVSHTEDQESAKQSQDTYEQTISDGNFPSSDDFLDPDDEPLKEDITTRPTSNKAEQDFDDEDDFLKDETEAPDSNTLTNMLASMAELADEEPTPNTLIL